MRRVKNHVKYLILGAGPTGLGAGFRFKESEEESFLLCEGSDRVGGLATSYRDEKGFVWDIGGHIQFSHYHYFDKLMDLALGKDGWHHHKRESWIWLKDRFAPYPLQNNIRYLPKETMWSCLKGLIQAAQAETAIPPSNFKEWLEQSFGPGLNEVFLAPYNFKVWGFPLETMAFDWIGDRVATVNLEKITENILFERDDVSWGPNSTFRFPKKGGTGSIWQAVGDLIGQDKIFLNTRLQEVRVADRTAYFEDGTIVSFDHLLNTIPLVKFLPMCKELSASFQPLVEQFKYSSTHVVGIGIEGKVPLSLSNKCWMYFPESNNPFYRVTVFSNYSPENVPSPQTQWSLMAEVSDTPHKPVNRERIIDEVIQGMLATKLLSPQDKIVDRWSYFAEQGYPTPFIGRDKLLDQIHKLLEPQGISTRGRFGGWKYEVSNQDHSLMQGVEWANRKLFGIPETTYYYPNVANANWGRPPFE